MKTVNIRDVAREAGTSTASVSRWLNGQPGVSRRTGERIMETAHRLGYRPALQRKTGVIALILPSLRIQSLGYYTIELLNAFRQEAAKRGSGVLITALEDAGLLRENMVSGAISFDFLRSIGRSFPNLKNLPLVCLNDPGNPLEEVGTVLTDERAGIRRALQFLREKGHRRIGFLSFQDEKASLANERRVRAFTEESGGLAGIEPELPPPTLPVTDAVCAILEKRCSALIIAGEGYEGPVLRTLAMLGKRIPEDLSVITYETPESCFRTPRQTTIGQDFPAIAAAALHLLETMLKGETHPAPVEIPPLFTVRESVGPFPLS